MLSTIKRTNKINGYFNNLLLILAVATQLLISLNSFADPAIRTELNQNGEISTPDTSSKQTTRAEEIFLQMLESAITGESIEQKVSETNGKVTYGAEKEGSSSLITRIMGPNKKEIKNYLDSKITAENRSRFIRNFLIKWVKGSYRVNQVKNISGEVKDFDFTQWNTRLLMSMDDTILYSTFEQWLDAAGDKWFSFVAPSIRRKIFNGELDGQDGISLGKTKNHSLTTSYLNWVPLYGLPERYITNSHNTGVGWEINFNPMPNFAEFNKMKDWFSEALKNAGERFGLPGHQRLVFPARTEGDPKEIALAESKLAEIYKNVQAFIILKGQEGHSGMEVARFKNPATDKTLTQFGASSRDLLRLEHNRFGKDTYGIEIRGGTKTNSTQQLVQMVIASRYASNDFEGIFESKSWTLIDESTLTSTTDDLIRRFDVPRKIAEDALSNLLTPSLNVRSANRKINIKFLTPFWGWENAPYLSSKKKEALKKLTRVFIVSAASWKNPSINDLLNALQTWAIASNLTTDIRRYMSPLFNNKNYSQEKITQILNYEHNANKKNIDVNSIDLGIEYTARYPISLRADYVTNVLKSQNYGWINTQYDLTNDERKSLLKKVAESLVKELGGSPGSVAFSNEQTHGNSLEMAYELKDSQGRGLRVEWDGIGRDYDPESKVISDSVRGGHIEVVTPKFVPSAEDIQAIFKVFKKLNLVPSNKAGGGHINIDLAPFQGRPEALAKFITLFNNHKGIIALMFQHPQRLRSAEPVELSTEVGNKLAHFTGSEEELKQLLYNERYFNTRLGRKSRYIQMDLSAYFQDVIPPEFIQKDFDIKNDPWRRNFNVEPKIRKAEFRLFNAPSNEVESAFQIRLVRGLLNMALNGNPTDSLSWTPQSVNYESYVKDPWLAFDHLEKLADTIGIEVNDYKRFVIDGLATTKAYITSNQYKPLETQLMNFPKQDGWGKAVNARSESEAISSEGRILPLSEKTLSPDSMKLLEQRIEDRETMTEIRNSNNPGKVQNGKIDHTDIEGKINSIFNLTNKNNLPMDDKLYLLFKSFSGDERKKAKVLFNKLYLRAGDFDRKVKSGLNMNDLNIYHALVRKESFESAIVLGFDRNDVEYKEWLLTIIDQNSESIPLIQRIAKEAHPKLQSYIIDLLKKHDPNTKVRIITSLMTSEIHPKLLLPITEILKPINLDSLNIEMKSRLSYSHLDFLNKVSFNLNNLPTSELINAALNLIDLGIKQLGHKYLSQVKRPISTIFQSNPQLSTAIFNKLKNLDKSTLPALTSLALASNYQNLRNHAWQVFYKEFILDLLSADKNTRELALLYLHESSDAHFILRVFLTAKMYQSPIPEVKTDFFKFFSKIAIDSETNVESHETLLKEMKNVIISGKELEIIEMILAILRNTQDTKLVGIAIELLNHQNLKVRQTASRLYNGILRNSDLILSAARDLTNSDSVIRENAKEQFAQKNITIQIPLLLHMLTAGSETEKLAAKNVVRHITSYKEFDLGLRQAIEWKPEYRPIAKEIITQPDFQGLESIKAFYSYEDITHDRKPFTIEKIQSLSDLNFIIITKDLLRDVQSLDNHKMIVSLIISRDFSKSSFDLSEFTQEALSLLRFEDETRLNLSLEILLRINAKKQNDYFFKNLHFISNNSKKELTHIALAKIIAKNTDLAGFAPIIETIKKKGFAGAIKILDEALMTSSNTRSCKKLFKAS